MAIAAPGKENKSNTVDLAPAAALLVARARGALSRRLDWLATGATDDAAAERAWAAGRDDHGQDAAARRLAGPEGATWRRLTGLFALNAAEADLLCLALAVAADPALGPDIAAAQGEPRRHAPTEALARRLFGHGPRPIWRAVSPLAAWHLLSAHWAAPGVAPSFEAAPVLVDWCFNTASLDAGLAGIAVPPEDHAPLPEWPVNETARRLARVLERGGPVRLVVESRRHSGRIGFAAAVARALGLKAVIIDPAAIPAEHFTEGFLRAQRFGLFAEAALLWRAGGPAWPDTVPLSPVQMVAVDVGEAPPARRDVADIRVALPEPGAETRLALWRRLNPQSTEKDAAALKALAETPGLTIGDLAATARAAPASIADAAQDLRARARARLGGAGRAIEPVLGWDDIILPAAPTAELQAFAFEARARARLLADPEACRLFGRDATLSALFSGPAGVGKTMAAQAVAGELGVNLLIVDLGATVSKFIGETAKTLTRIFAQAEAAGAVLFFDEADALFAKRTDVRDSHDRYANADTNHLLQLLESYGGVVILASNKRANLDPAFLRRMRHVIEFPRAAEAQQKELWQRLTAVLAGAAASSDLKPACARLAAAHSLSPAQIKSAVLSARYAALAAGRAMNEADLAAGARRELAKEGRGNSAQSTDGKGRRRRG
ncbi:MAG: ATP-binding protein [Kiloniellaceae bacterium]